MHIKKLADVLYRATKAQEEFLNDVYQNDILALPEAVEAVEKQQIEEARRRLKPKSVRRIRHSVWINPNIKDMRA